MSTADIGCFILELTVKSVSSCLEAPQMENLNPYLLNRVPSETRVLGEGNTCNCVDKLLSLQDYENNEELSNLFLAPELQAQWLRPLQAAHGSISHGLIRSPAEPVEEVGSCADHINSANMVEEKKRSMDQDEDVVESTCACSLNTLQGNLLHVIQADNICSHPLFMRFLTGHIECSKVGVSDQTAVPQLDQLVGQYRVLSTKSIPIGSRPDLDQFMVAYCSMLDSHREEMNGIFNETTEFLKTLEKNVDLIRMGDLSGLRNRIMPSTDLPQCSHMEAKLQATIHAMMEEGIQPPLTKFQMSQISQVTKEVKEEINAQKAKRYSRLPEDATVILQEWWDKNHEINPYPSKNDKLEFIRCTGLEPKQIENWFSNQRKKSCAS